MVRLKPWQWMVLLLPIASIIGFLLIAAGWQIHEWRLNWIWAIFTLVLVGWRWLLVQWTQPVFKQMQAVVEEVQEEMQAELAASPPIASGDITQQAEAALQSVLTVAQSDPPVWEDWELFWQRCKELVNSIAHIYYPTVKYPLLNIYIPQAYGLIRGTVDDTDQWMQKLSPVLNQVTVGQAVQAYEVYQQLEPSARKLWRVWTWAQWVFNPAAAAARQASQRSSDRATQQLLINLGQLMRESALRNLCRQAVILYGNTVLAGNSPTSSPALPKAKTETLRDILTQAKPVETVEQLPINILLVGRTGAGKSSLINTLFQADRAEVDVLPSTDKIQSYHWKTPTGETLTLWDSPGYEQVNRSDLRELVLDYAASADLLLLVTPALDPALQMDADFLKDVKADVSELPAIAIVTQVDRLRPIREWEPPYDWQWGDRPKEISIREATQYRAELLGEYCDRVLPIVTGDVQSHRAAWGADTLSLALIEAIDPAKQIRLARFLNNLESRTVAAAKIIDHYTFQMTTTQGIASLLKSPVLQFISTLTTGSPALAYVLAEQIPVEQLPLVIGKLQMAYDLFSLFNTSTELSDRVNAPIFDLRSLWALLLENSSTPDRNAWAFGHALVEYWTRDLSIVQLRERFEYYLNQQASK
jgi:predicted GTPase